jgi:hypothetical protein
VGLQALPQRMESCRDGANTAHPKTLHLSYTIPQLRKKSNKILIRIASAVMLFLVLKVLFHDLNLRRDDTERSLSFCLERPSFIHGEELFLSL